MSLERQLVLEPSTKYLDQSPDPHGGISAELVGNLFCFGQNIRSFTFNNVIKDTVLKRFGRRKSVPLESNFTMQPVIPYFRGQKTREGVRPRCAEVNLKRWAWAEFVTVANCSAYLIHA